MNYRVLASVGAAAAIAFAQPVAFIAQEVVDFGEHETWNIASPRPVNGIAEAPVIRRALDKIVDQGAGIADERGSATDRH